MVRRSAVVAQVFGSLLYNSLLLPGFYQSRGHCRGQVSSQGFITIIVANIVARLHKFPSMVKSF